MNQKDSVFENYFKNNKKPTVTTHITKGNSSPSYHSYSPQTVSQRADSNADMESFTDIFKSLLDDTWEDGWGTFTVESPTGNDPESIAMPCIIFDVENRVPSKNKTGIKSRQLEIIPDPDDEDYTLIVSRKWFDCEVSFLIINQTNREASRLMSKLESFIETYIGYFKRNGISELIFLREDKEKLRSKALEGVPSKCLIYLMVLERISVERVRTTKEIRSQIKADAPTTTE